MTSSTNLIPLPNRGVLSLSGPDKAAFLQGLISNDVAKINSGTALYACLLTPQGKFLHDFFLIESGDVWLIDCERHRSADLLKRLSMYKLRSQIELTDVSGQYQILASFEKPELHNAIIVADPRHKDMGYRVFKNREEKEEEEELSFLYERQRISLCIPDGSRDMEINKDLIMDFALDRLNGVDFNKGCYLGQEMTSRMFFRDLIKKEFVRVQVEGEVPQAHAPLFKDGKEQGQIKTSLGGTALALLRKDVVAMLKNAPIQYENFTFALV